MSHDLSNLNKLLQSKSKSAQLLGFAIALVLFVPSVCRIAGDPDLTLWQRIEQLSIAAGQTLLTVGVAAIPPETLTASGKERKEEQPSE